MYQGKNEHNYLSCTSTLTIVRFCSLFFAVESVKFERPLVTDMNVAGQRFNGIKHGWTSAHNEEDSMEVKAIFLAFEYVMLFCL